MTLLDWIGLKRLAAGVVVVFVLASPATTRAADDRSTAVPVPPANAAPGTETGGDTPAEEKQEAPRLQLQDEGPPAGSDQVRQPRIQVTQVDDTVDRPYWKNWVFWSVAGAVVAGAAVTLVYMASGNSDVAPCPVETAASLGCHGAGR